MSNIIHSSSLLNLVSGKSENSADLVKSEETQQGIDFKSIYASVEGEANRKALPDDQIPKDNFQKDPETTAESQKVDSGGLGQKLAQVQQPFGKILPTLVAHQRGLSFGKVILTAPVSAVSEHSLNEFIKRQNSVDQVIDGGRANSTESDNSAPIGIKQEETGVTLPGQKQAANADAFASYKSRSGGSTTLDQTRHQAHEILSPASENAAATRAPLSVKQVQPTQQLGNGADKGDALATTAAKSALVNEPASPSAAATRASLSVDQVQLTQQLSDGAAKSALVNEPVPSAGRTASWLSSFNQTASENYSGSPITASAAGVPVAAREANSGREELGLKAEPPLSRNDSEKKLSTSPLMVSKSELTNRHLMSAGAEKLSEEQATPKHVQSPKEFLSSTFLEKVLRGKEHPDGINPKHEMVAEALAQNLRMGAPSGQQPANLAGYQGQKINLAGAYDVSKRSNGASIESPDKVNVQNLESKVEFRSLLREMQHPTQIQSSSDRTLQYEGLAQKFGELVANRIIAGVQQDNWNLNIKLRPASLGEIGVTIAYDEGGLEGKIVAAEDATRQLLQDSLPRLRAVLKDMLDNNQMVNVNVDSNSDSQQNTKDKADHENDVAVEMVMDIFDEADENAEGRGLGIGNLNIYV